ncbi:hypothetical protein E6H35_00380 [Candidatus Bathyarchaeota archaeon]|nr:MAG: hypothetical protein E6H35_00380 [Candidatus Bathyarchaeota archaeon]
MRSPLTEIFYETLEYCFGKTLLETLGPTVQASIYDLLKRSGIRKEDISNRFDDVVQALTSTLGTCSRVVVHRTVVEMFKEYSQRLDFSYTDSLRDRLAVLKEAVVANHVLPRRLRDESAFDSVEKPEWTGPDVPKGQAYNSLYPMKKGVKT